MSYMLACHQLCKRHTTTFSTRSTERKPRIWHEREHGERRVSRRTRKQSYENREKTLEMITGLIREAIGLPVTFPVAPLGYSSMNAMSSNPSSLPVMSEKPSQEHLSPLLFSKEAFKSCHSGSVLVRGRLTHTSNARDRPMSERVWGSTISTIQFNR